jgi:glutathione peroxidase
MAPDFTKIPVISMTDRRALLQSIAAGIGACALAPAAGNAQSSRVTAYAFSFAGLDGKDIRLAEYTGTPILVVNTASQCGFTPQYSGLQALWTRYRDKGLLIVGVPSNDFGGQEPGSSVDIDKTAHGQYGVSFPISAKVAVRGPEQHPFYRWAAQERPLDVPRWNFHKYLVGRDGHIAGSFASAVEPSDPKFIAAIGKELESRPS